MSPSFHRPPGGPIKCRAGGKRPSAPTTAPHASGRCARSARRLIIYVMGKDSFKGPAAAAAAVPKLAKGWRRQPTASEGRSKKNTCRRRELLDLNPLLQLRPNIMLPSDDLVERDPFGRVDPATYAPKVGPQRASLNVKACYNFIGRGSCMDCHRSSGPSCSPPFSFSA
jgi:hypothetical protein